MVDYKRQIALFNPENHKDRHVTIIGLGNIGSHTALALTRLGIRNFTLYDFDEIEAHNLSSQAYSIHDVGLYKGAVLMEEMQKLNDALNIHFIPTAFQEGGEVKDIVVIAVDSMETRYDICKMIEDKNVIVVDGRMGGGQCEVHTGRASEWKGTLKEDADTDECSARYISYTSYIIAGMVTNTVKRILQNETVPKSTYLHTATWDVLKIKS